MPFRIRRTLAKLFLALALVVFLSANTAYFFEVDANLIYATVDKPYELNYDNVGKQGPYLNLKAALLVDFDNGEVLYSRNPHALRPIASISKLVAAMVIIDKGMNLNRLEIITRQDARLSSKSRFRVGYQMSLNDMLYAALIGSDNRAIRALARACCGTVEEFTKEMNKKARRLGLRKTHFKEPTGLDSGNVSTANEVALIIYHAYQYDLIAKITSIKKYRIPIRNRKNLYRNISNTNLLTISPYKVRIGKTGYIIASDYCLATMVSNKKGKRLTAVVLGVPKERLRFREARRMLDWGFRQFP